MSSNIYAFFTAFFVICGILPLAYSDSGDKQTVNILFFYERKDSIKSFDAALAFVEGSSHGIKIGRVDRIRSPRIDPINGTQEEEMQSFRTVCAKVNQAYAKQKPDVIIDFTRFGTSSEIVKLIAKMLKMPTISGSFGQEEDIKQWNNLGSKQKKYLLQIAPAADMVPQEIRSVVAKQDMVSAAILFDEDFEMYHKYKSLLQNLPTRHLIARVEKNTPGIRRQIDRLVHVDLVNYFLLAKPDQVGHVLAEASDPQMRDGPYFSDEYSWYSLSMVPGIPKCGGCKINVTLIHFAPDFKDPKTNDRLKFFETQGIRKSLHVMDLFYYDLAINTILTVGEMKKNGTFDAPPDEKCEEIDNPLEGDYALPFIESFKSMQKIYKEDNALATYEIDESIVGNSFVKLSMVISRLTFTPFQPEPTSLKPLGVWEAGFTENQLIKSGSIEDPYWKEHKIITVFRIVTVVQPPFVYKKEGCDEKLEKYSRCFYGYCIDLLDKIVEKLQFNYTIRNVSGYGYMADEYPHEWSGMVRELGDKKADIALGAMSVMAERESMLDFTVPYYDLVGISIMMRKPKAQTSLFKFLTVLENEVWMTILAAYFFTSFLMWAFDRWSPYSLQNNPEPYEEDEEKRDFNWKECLWFCMTSLTPQGGGEAPKNLSGRLVAATWWLFGFVVIASYTANLAAFLTVDRLDATIESLDDLVNQYKLQYAPMEDSFAWVYFNRMSEIERRFNQIWRDMSLDDNTTELDKAQLSVWDYPVSDKYARMWAAMKENEPPLNFEDAVARVRGETGRADGFAFLGDATDIRYQALISCDLKMVGEEFSRKPYSLAVQQGSPLKDQLNDAILMLLNQRQLEQLKETWWNENPLRAKCPRDDNESDGISIHNIGGVFIVIFAGIVVAMCTLIFEYFWNRKKAKDAEKAEEELTVPTAKSINVNPFGDIFTTDKKGFNTAFNKSSKPRSTEIQTVETHY